MGNRRSSSADQLKTCLITIGYLSSLLVMISPCLFSSQNLTKSPTPEDSFKQIELDIQAQKLERAWQNLESLPSGQTDCATFHFLRGWILLEKQQYREAEKDLNEAISRDPRNARYYQLRGRLFEQQHEMTKAKADLYKAIELEPDKLAGYLLLIGAMADHTELVAETRRVVDSALVRFPQSAELFYAKGHLEDVQHEEAQAILDYSRAIELNPKVPFFHGRLASLLRNDPQKIPLAREHFKKAISLEPDNAEWHYELGITEMKLENWEAARAPLEKGTELAPADRAIAWALAQVYQRLKMPEHAAQYRERAAQLARSGELPGAEFLRALNLEIEGKTAEAETQYQELLKSHPSPKVYYALARLYANTGQSARAEAPIRSALQFDPQNPSYHLLFAMILLDLDRLEEAEKATRLAIELNPNDSALRNLFGNLLLKISKIEEAIQSYQAAIELAPREATYHLNLSSALRRAGKVPAADQEMELYLSLTREKTSRPQSSDLAK